MTPVFSVTASLSSCNYRLVRHSPTNCTGEASNFEQASLDFFSLISCWGKLTEIVYFAGKSLCNSMDESTNSWFIIGQARVANYFKKTSRRQESQGDQNLFFRRQRVASSCRGGNFFWQQVHDELKTFSPKPIPRSQFVFSVTLQQVDFSAIDSILSRIIEITLHIMKTTQTMGGHICLFNLAFLQFYPLDKKLYDLPWPG